MLMHISCHHWIQCLLNLENLPSSFPLNLHRKNIVLFFCCCFRMNIYLKCLFADYVYQIILCFNLRYSKLSLLSQEHSSLLNWSCHTGELNTKWYVSIKSLSLSFKNLCEKEDRKFQRTKSDRWLKKNYLLNAAEWMDT